MCYVSLCYCFKMIKQQPIWDIFFHRVYKHTTVWKCRLRLPVKSNENHCNSLMINTTFISKSYDNFVLISSNFTLPPISFTVYEDNTMSVSLVVYHPFHTVGLEKPEILMNFDNTLQSTDKEKSGTGS